MGYFWSQFKLIGNDRNFEDCARGVETILNTPVMGVSSKAPGELEPPGNMLHAEGTLDSVQVHRGGTF